MRFAKDCWPLVAPPAVAAAVLLAFGHYLWAILTGLLSLLLLLFFRIPTRRSDGAVDRVLAPANGRIIGIDRIVDAEIGPGSFHRIATFLSVFDVHVQRAPVEGEVFASRYSPGRKLAAFHPRAGDVNEQHLTVLRRSNGDLVGVRQIAGLVARRVVTYLERGQRVDRGDLLGLIKFGSRVDLMLPLSYHLEVRVGQRVREGETPIASSEFSC